MSLRVIVDRKRWLRGQGASYLLDPISDKMCCLGFAALVTGGTEDQILGKRVPSEVPELLPMLVVPHSCRAADCSSSDLEDFPLAQKLMEANDDRGSTDAFRETEIIQLGTEAGLEFEFVG